ncbi:MAG TPA: MobA/MobL family protein [Burkholderiaceae bacterium]|nr:MobA/MobL family protein [Burkholderiaceae bacterium]
MLCGAVTTRLTESGGKIRLELRDEAFETRRNCAEIQNAAFAKYGHDACVDHRTLTAQGITRRPEHHLGQARIIKMSIECKAEHVTEREETAA